VKIKEVRVQVPLTSTPTSRICFPHVESHNGEEEEQINDLEIKNEFVVEQPQEILLRISQRERKSTILNDLSDLSTRVRK